MGLTSDSRLLSLSTPLGKDALQVVQCRGEEAISDLYRFELELFSTDPALEWQSWSGRPPRCGWPCRMARLATGMA
ncbi:hypothetical protein O0544_14600 [Edwardsiella anguillarum]|nr:hypothetical protein [Edwardsiella anguillarum]